MPTEIVHEEAVIELAHKAKGHTIDELWKLCTLFENRCELARALNYCVKLTLLIKDNNKYYSNLHKQAQSIGARVEAVAEGIETHKLPRNVRVKKSTKPVAPTPAAVKVIKTAQETQPKKYGSLSTFRVISHVAMALYIYRDRDHMTLEQIITIIGKPGLKIGAALRELCNLRYVYRRVTKTGAIYKWSETFDYPFPRILQSDAKHIALLPT